MPAVKRKDIDEIWKSIRTINHELGGVEASIKAIEQDIKWIREKMDKIDSRFYQILISIFILVISTIVGFMMG